MLEDRPILQRSLIGFGAFSFVFTAAMAGSAFMISGGFDLGGRDRPATMAQYATAAETAWNDFAPPAYAAPPDSAGTQQAAYVYPEAAESIPDAYDTPTELEGDARGERVQTQQRSTEDIPRDIEREFAESARYAETSAEAAPAPEAYEYYSEPVYDEPVEAEPEQPGYDPYVAAEKEQEAVGYTQY